MTLQQLSQGAEHEVAYEVQVFVADLVLFELGHDAVVDEREMVSFLVFNQTLLHTDVLWFNVAVHISILMN